MIKICLANPYIGKSTWTLVLLVWMTVNIQAQTFSFISDGDMENGNWSAVQGNTNMSRTFESGTGIGATTSLKIVTTTMGADQYYILRCEEFFQMTQNDKVTISFWAKGSVTDMRLQPWVQEADGNQWMDFGDAYLTTNWKRYQFTVNLTTQTSNNYKIKFRGYNTGIIYLDNVEIGPVDYEDVQQSGIYEVTLSQNGMTWPLNVFRNTCPTFALGYQNMQSKDEGPLELFAGRTINWTKFSFEDPITVRVKVINTTKVPVSGQTVKIFPSRHGVSSTTSGNTVTFTITEPGQYAVEIGPNGYKNGLIIFADPLETDIPSQTDPDFLVLYEADAGDVSNIPGTYNGVYFRRGVHDIGVFNIPNHIKKVYFEEGSWVYGALIMDGNSDVRIYGRGVLSSYKFNYRQTHCVEAINNSNNITVEGLVVADPKYFAVRLIGNNNTVTYTKVIGGWVYNCDGISAFAGSNVSKCFIWANDDAIKVYRDSITWSDIVVWQLNNGGVIQMSWGGDIGGTTAKGVTISRVDVIRAEWNLPRFNCALLNMVGNHYQQDGRYSLQENWLIEDVVTENPVPVVFKITPDPYTHCHIHGLYLKNWNVKMPMGTSFVNEIKGEDSNDFFSGFVFDNVVFNNKLLTNINYITNGDMENGGWVGVPKTTDQVVTLEAGLGTGGSTGLRSVVTNMGGGDHYIMKGNEHFHMDNNQEIAISFFARATAAGKKLVPWVQRTDNNNWMNVGEVFLTTGWKWYSTTATLNQGTSDYYQVKFRGYETAWMFLDKVQIGPPNWRTIMQPEIQYLNTPTFLPEYTQERNRTPMTTGSQPIVEEAFALYPNPVEHTLFIKGFESPVPYRIIGIKGGNEVSGFDSQIEVSKLAPGMYILIIDGKKRIKFVKK